MVKGLSLKTKKTYLSSSELLLKCSITRCIPFSVLHSWSDVVLKALTEILDRLSRQSDKIQSASLSMQFGTCNHYSLLTVIILNYYHTVEVSKDSLHQQIEELEKKLNDSDRGARNCRQKIISLGIKFSTSS